MDYILDITKLPHLIKLISWYKKLSNSNHIEPMGEMVNKHVFAHQFALANNVLRSPGTPQTNFDVSVSHIKLQSRCFWSALITLILPLQMIRGESMWGSYLLNL